jgi:hypothetical protein
MRSRHFTASIYMVALLATGSAFAQTSQEAATPDTVIQSSTTITTQTVPTIPPVDESINKLLDLQGNECDVSKKLDGARNPCMSLDLIHNTNLGAVITKTKDAPIVGARTLAGTMAETAIDAWGYCRYIRNQSTHSMFVPFKSLPEWKSYIIDNTPPNINLLDCSRGGWKDVPPNYGPNAQTNQCHSNPTAQQVLLPYAPFPPSATFAPPEVKTYTCLSPDGTTFVETARGYYYGLDSGKEQDLRDPPPPGWDIDHVDYVYDGICGTANKVAAPNNFENMEDGLGFLCHVGAHSALNNNKTTGIWEWACLSGNGGGITASCSTANLASVSLTPHQCTGIGAGPVDMSILVDASASMQPLVDATAVAFQDLLTQLTPFGSNINYNVVMIGGKGGYTPASGGGCPYGQLTPFGQPDVTTTVASLNKVTASNNTPIASAMNYATSFLTNPKHQRAMVVISDGVETCAKSINIVPTIQQIQSKGIRMFGVYMENDIYYKHGSTDSVQGAANFAAMTAHNSITASGVDNQLSGALADMLTQATTSTCELNNATITTPAGKVVGTLTPTSPPINLQPGNYNITYTQCGQPYVQVTTIVAPKTTLDPGIPCP